MKFLLLGSNGQLGFELSKAAKQRGFNCQGLDKPLFDITDQKTIYEVICQEGISFVVNAAAYTAVDKAESERDCAFAVNNEGAGYLAGACAERNLPLIHISTDYVFDGSKKAPYVETDPINPISVYGESKAAGENAVRNAHGRHIILRTSWLYGSHGNNFVKTILRLASEREELRVVADQYGCPTYAADLASAILSICDRIQRRERIEWGTYHYCGAGVTTWHEFARQICEKSRRYVALRCSHVKAITTEEFPTPAKRPPYSALDCKKIEASFGIARTFWQDSLAEMLELLVTNKPIDE